MGSIVGREKFKWRQLAQVNEPVHTEKLKPMIKGQISGKLVSSGISHVAFASVLLGENPSEEVDTYYCYE